MFDENFSRPSGETDAEYRKRHNARLAKQQLEDGKRLEAETARRRKEWQETPDSERLCTQCGLKLDSVTVARIAENPVAHKAEHDFCNSFSIEPGVARGLADLLREAYGEDEIPLDTLRTVIETYRDQRGFCAISRIKLVFPEPEGKPPVIEARASYSFALSSFENEIIRHQRAKEETQSKRHAELHSAVLDYSEDGKLRLISRTVARCKEGLSDEEFKALIHTLHEEFKTLPTSQSHHPLSVAGSLTRRYIR